MEIALPKQFEDQYIVEFLNKLEKHKDDEKVCTDYSQVEFVKPFATLLLAIGIRDFLRYRFDRNLKTTSKGQKKESSALSYLKLLGFFQYIGLNVGLKPNDAKGGDRYLPIMRLSEVQFLKEGLRLQVGIDKECGRLARIIYADRGNDMRATMLSYCLREIIRNVFEHAETKECYILAQKWDNGFAEIAIADRGVGLATSLKKSFEIQNAHEAIETALKPGISSDTSPVNDDAWQNSGFGLYVVSELGSQLGEFAIGSDNQLLFCHNNDKDWFEAPIRGTVVKLRVNTDDAEYFPNILHNIVANGEEIAQTIPGSKKTASKKSKMSEDIN